MKNKKKRLTESWAAEFMKILDQKVAEVICNNHIKKKKDE